ncbi:FxsB family radical SAM/SPASM domain protein [Pedobacter sp. KBW06]|uniref:cyclophane-forming radical SAM/SPASM peptide maturase YhhB n=1 Tax=Pedobacter sp. KBW06 TaxID=2153359 RepID=UPI000F5B51A2|nr:cyclophane-forming radical SAM/SPASM peptide maturase YhhB [Pedobacter sp. KBW06]RQO74418.1 FxsB family radical SAM/SPASM domain protein [Pedobacter sp. KBW06]
MDNNFAPATISCFLLKVASRCNINCDYCYMYNHLDQSYKLQPKIMSKLTMDESSRRIVEYAREQKLKRIAIVYHGGEPLLMNSQKFIDHISSLKTMMPSGTEIEFSMQTNGVLLKEEDLILFELHGLQVSLSLDGPKSANDRHRVDHKGESSFVETENALKLLKKYPKVFSGVIAVIDPRNDPGEVLEYFSDYDLPQLDFLLPDANFLTTPPLRAEKADIYRDWLISCFDIWFERFPNLKIRTFDSILAGLLGVPSDTDGFGFGDVSLITIETDGSYHDLDVLKITGSGTHLKQGDVFSNSIQDVVSSGQLEPHRKLLRMTGLAKTCQECDIVEICGGGAVAHRFGENGYENPSIYCYELKSLINHIQFKVLEELAKEESSIESELPTDTIIDFEIRSLESGVLENALTSFKKQQVVKLLEVLEYLGQDFSGMPDQRLQSASIMPSVVVWTEVMEKKSKGIPMKSAEGSIIDPDPKYLWKFLASKTDSKPWPLVNRSDFWLRVPFGKEIYFEDDDTTSCSNEVLQKSIALIERWKPEIVKEMNLISPELQFIRDTSADPDQVVSFSDNSVPGALYVQLIRSGKFIDPRDLADSIIHEHRHQKLYLLQRISPIVHDDHILVHSPWRTELRPPSGLFHALYVFVELLDFWHSLKGDADSVPRAQNECRIIAEKIKKGFDVIDSCSLTQTGLALVEILKHKVKNVTYGIA